MKSLGRNWIFALIFALSPVLVLADLTALIPESTIAVIAEETSGVAAKRNLDTITLYHRTRASTGWLEPGDVAAYLAALERIGVVL